MIYTNKYIQKLNLVNIKKNYLVYKIFLSVHRGWKNSLGIIISIWNVLHTYESFNNAIIIIIIIII